MKKTRTQKKRNMNDYVQSVKQMTAHFAMVVDNIYNYSEWVIAMSPDGMTAEEYPLVKWFIAHTLVYFNLFKGKDEEGNTVIFLDKEKLIESMKSSDEISSRPYTETFTKDMALATLDKCFDKFFNNELIKVVDKKDEVK